MNSQLRLIASLDFEVELFAKLRRQPAPHHPGYQAIEVVPGIGPVLAAVFVAEVGDVGRFPGPPQLASWAGLTPLHRESDTTVHRGRITEQAPDWCAGRRSRPCNACPPIPVSGRSRDRIGARRGRNIGVVAAARELIGLVFYGVRDHHIRCLAPRTAAA